MNKTLCIILFISIYSCGGPGGGTTITDGINTLDHRIFITAGTTTGKIISGVLTGLDAADKICKDAAEGAGLNRDYKAILGTPTTTAKSRLILSGKILMVAGTQTITIADSSDDLWNADTTQLQYAITLNENETQVSTSEHVWSGTESDGTSNTDACVNWTSLLNTDDGAAGNIGSTDENWIYNPSLSKNCSTLGHLYCISQ